MAQIKDIKELIQLYIRTCLLKFHFHGRELFFVALMRIDILQNYVGWLSGLMLCFDFVPSPKEAKFKMKKKLMFGWWIHN